MDFLPQLYDPYVSFEQKGKLKRKLLNYMEFQEKPFQLSTLDGGNPLTRKKTLDILFGIQSPWLDSDDASTPLPVSSLMGRGFLLTHTEHCGKSSPHTSNKGVHYHV